MGSRYRILQELGRGAMATVYLAQDTYLQRRVALKVPHFRPGGGLDLQERFYRASRAAATLTHPNICPIYDVGEVLGVPYLTMPYIEGPSLAEVLCTSKPMPPRRAVEIVARLARALNEAHRDGVVHGDLNPSNVLVNRGGEPILIGFGLARRVDEDVELTHRGPVVQTPAYMSAEQINADAQQIGPLSDQYSLGVMLYELLTGQVPFQGTIGRALPRIPTETPKPPASLRADLDPALERACLRAMARKPADRYPSMAELGDALARCLDVATGGQGSQPASWSGVSRTER
jgi:serine/threonine protein kinase